MEALSQRGNSNSSTEILTFLKSPCPGGLPRISLGTGLQKPSHVRQLIHHALNCGFRSFDTAPLYGTESAIGEAIRQSSIPRTDVCLTSKVRGYDTLTTRSIEVAVKRSLREFNTNYLDIIMPHWPLPMIRDPRYTYEVLIRLRNEGIARHVGLSNPALSQVYQYRIATGEWPYIAQAHLSPYIPQVSLQAGLSPTPTIIQAYRIYEHGHALHQSVTIQNISERLGSTPAAVLLKWHFQQGRSAVVGASTTDQITSLSKINLPHLTRQDFSQIEKLSMNGVGAPDPYVEFEL